MTVYNKIEYVIDFVSIILYCLCRCQYENRKILKEFDMGKKLTKRDLQALETRKKIYEAGKSLFSKYGYDAVSVEDIVEKAGVARGSFYVYFLSKEDLSVYLMMDTVGDYQSYMKDFCAAMDKDMSATDLIAQTACGICTMVRDWGVSTMRTVYKIFIARSEGTGTSYRSFFEMPELFTNLYELGVSRGELVATDSGAVAEDIKTILIGLTFEWCLYHPDYDFIGKTKLLITNYLEGYKTTKK